MTKGDVNSCDKADFNHNCQQNPQLWGRKPSMDISSIRILIIPDNSLNEII